MVNGVPLNRFTTVCLVSEWLMDICAKSAPDLTALVFAKNWTGTQSCKSVTSFLPNNNSIINIALGYGNNGFVS